MEDFVNNAFGKATIILIFFVLGINTLRSILAYSGWLKNTRFANLVHDFISDEQSEKLIKNTLEEVGIRDSKHNALKNLNRHNIVSPVSFNNTQQLENLIVLLSKYTYKTDETIVYGKNTPTKTSYYVNTMDASLNKSDNEVMCNLARQLMVYMYQKHQRPDFVVVPKMGNPTFVTEFAKQGNILCLLRKADADHSRVKFEKHGNTASSIVNLEGAYHLQQLAEKSTVPLYGVVLDCNCSGGSSLLRTATEFNKIIREKTLNIIPIDHAYVLFRPDTEIDVNKKFKEKDVELIRYFDLNEDIKKQLFELKLELEKNNFEVHKKACEKKIENIIIDLKRQRLIEKGL